MNWTPINDTDAEDIRLASAADMEKEKMKPAKVPELTEVERVVYTSIHAVWEVRGLDNGEWDAVRSSLQAVENCMWTLEGIIKTPEHQLFVECQQALNFLWWNTHAADYGERDTNPYHKDFKEAA